MTAVGRLIRGERKSSDKGDFFAGTLADRTKVGGEWVDRYIRFTCGFGIPTLEATPIGEAISVAGQPSFKVYAPENRAPSVDIDLTVRQFEVVKSRQIAEQAAVEEPEEADVPTNVFGG